MLQATWHEKGALSWQGGASYSHAKPNICCGHYAGEKKPKKTIANSLLCIPQIRSAALLGRLSGWAKTSGILRGIESGYRPVMLMAQHCHLGMAALNNDECHDAVCSVTTFPVQTVSNGQNRRDHIDRIGHMMMDFDWSVSVEMKVITAKEERTSLGTK